MEPTDTIFKADAVKASRKERIIRSACYVGAITAGVLIKVLADMAVEKIENSLKSSLSESIFDRKNKRVKNNSGCSSSSSQRDKETFFSSRSSSDYSNSNPFHRP